MAHETINRGIETGEESSFFCYYGVSKAFHIGPPLSFGVDADTVSQINTVSKIKINALVM